MKMRKNKKIHQPPITYSREHNPIIILYLNEKLLNYDASISHKLTGSTSDLLNR